MTLLVLLMTAIAIGGGVAVLSWRWGGRTAPATLRTAREAAAAMRRHPRLTGTLSARWDPEAATGLALTLALLAIVAGGVLVGVLAYLVRATTDLAWLDDSAADWADRHASAFSTDGLNAITHLGEPKVVIALAAALAVVQTVRTRSTWVVPFLLVVVAGNGVLTTTVKNLVERVRPDLNPIAETLGPSFPSGHSSWSAAFFAAAALLLSRGRGRATRAGIAGCAAALAVTVAGSRVLLDVHWLSDVIAGLALGSAWFSVCAIAFGGRVLRFGAAAAEASRAARGRGGAARAPG